MTTTPSRRPLKRNPLPSRPASGSANPTPSSVAGPGEGDPLDEPGPGPRLADPGADVVTLPEGGGPDLAPSGGGPEEGAPGGGAADHGPRLADDQVVTLPGWDPAPVWTPAPALPVSTDVDGRSRLRRPVSELDGLDLESDDDVPVVGEVGDEVPLSAASNRTPKKRRRITARDMDILRFLNRYKAATAVQVAQRFEMSEVYARRRLPNLRDAGLVSNRLSGPARFSVWSVTSEGAALVLLDLPAPRTMPLSMLRHTLGLTDLGLKFELAGETVLTETEIRVQDQRAAALARAQHGRSPRDSRGIHVPDLIVQREPVDGQPRSLAVELELHRKPPSLVERTLRRYGRSTNLAAVVYFTHSQEIRDLVMRSAEKVGVLERVSVQRWVPPEQFVSLDTEAS